MVIEGPSPRCGEAWRGPRLEKGDMTLTSVSFIKQRIPPTVKQTQKCPISFTTTQKITMSSNKELSEAFQKGLALRGEVLGEEYVTKAVAMLDDEYWAPVQEWITESGWAAIWSRPGLERKQRSLLSR